MLPEGAIKSIDELRSICANITKSKRIYWTSHKKFYSKIPHFDVPPNARFRIDSAECGIFDQTGSRVVSFGAQYGNYHWFMFTNYWFAYAYNLRVKKAE